MLDIGKGLRGVAVFLILLSLSPILADSRENKGEVDIKYLHDKIFANICKDIHLQIFAKILVFSGSKVRSPQLPDTQDALPGLYCRTY